MAKSAAVNRQKIEFRIQIIQPFANKGLGERFQTMGHQRMGKLPATRQWQAVVDMIAGGGEATSVASAAAAATAAALRKAHDDPGVVNAFYLLARVPLAAKEPDFAAALRCLGLQVASRPTLIELNSALLEVIERNGPHVRTTDLGSIAGLALVEVLSQRCLSQPGLFGLSLASDELRRALRDLSRPEAFGLLVQDFCARLVHRCLDYFLSRTMSDQVGVHRRFRSLKDQHTFTTALMTHCHEVALIVQLFGGQWASKTEYETGITRTNAGKFVYIAINKVLAELNARDGSPAHA